MHGRASLPRLLERRTPKSGARLSLIRYNRIYVSSAVGIQAGSECE